MATLEGKTNRYIGDPADPKPRLGRGLGIDDVTVVSTDLPAGSTWYETETGEIYRWDGQRWTLARNLLREAIATLTEAVHDMKQELYSLRLGMIDAGTCKETQ